jgi:molybdenum cofactor cytidylyltransferase
VQADVVAVVLAAGPSARLGRAKALVDLGGRSAVCRVAGTAADGGVLSGVVVVGDPHADEIRQRADVTPLAWALNPAPAAGRLGSIRCGLLATPRDTDVLLWPVDRPLAGVPVVEALLAARGEVGEAFVVSPVERGRRGHPLLVAAALRRRIVAAAPDTNLRTLLGGPDVCRIDVPVADGSGIHANLDTEEAVRRAQEGVDDLEGR